ncbi:M23/M56 family metallopeptidase [Labilibaculum sp. K2S]|uniref:M23/M56 family metallopeptidase n=1 Tax=Labilibaculum sp. K2S TaxID=3056386 RepID=UPI0025A419F8|nr:M23/M56 family metallopeptidase [Labilibaculum sp. K2S]MDM8160945.1 M23/M56 family metallopeptidase [Labilibaculum sp. K2S]
MFELGIYLLESGICLAGFYLAYKLLLAGDTFVARNRWYLLLITLLSLIIPLLSFSWGAESFSMLNQFTGEFEQSFQTEFIPFTDIDSKVSSFSMISLLLILYFIGVLLSLFRIVRHVFHLVKLIQANEIRICNGLKIVSVNENSSPYSFFGYVFLNPQLLPESEQEHVLLHESIHARQYHSLDLLFIELVKTVLWFNPFIYLVNRSLIEIHEYLADRECLYEGIDKVNYQKSLLRNVESQMMFALTSSFNSSLTLKRIKMIKKINTSQLAHLKIILVIPVLLISLLSFSFSESAPQFLEGNFDKFYPVEQLSFPLKQGEKIFISSGYGERIHPITKKKTFHNGMDVAAPKGTPVLSVSDGIVSKVNNQFVQGKGYGRFVIIDHQNGFSSLYSQMDSYSVKEGQKVSKGDLVGTIGTSGLTTGPHLHFELKKDGKLVNPADFFEKDLSAYQK